MERTLDILIRRNSNNDYMPPDDVNNSKDLNASNNSVDSNNLSLNSNILTHLGYDFLWNDFTPTNVSFNSLCRIGRRIFFGRNIDPPFIAQIRLYYNPSWTSGKKTNKYYRLYHHIYEEDVSSSKTIKSIFLFQDESPTNMTFKQTDHPYITSWCDLNQGLGIFPFEFRVEVVKSWN